MRVLAAVLALAACGGDDSTDIVGPFTGPVHRFVLDRIEVPQDGDAALRIAADLDGDGEVDNQLGNVTTVLSSIGDLSLDGPDMIASGALHSTLEIQADDLVDDPSVGVTYRGGSDDAALVVGGALAGGVFTPNRSATTRHPGRAIARLPIYTNADPLPIELDGLEIELAADGAGGFDATIRGGVRTERARAVAYSGLQQMFATEPLRHLVFQRGVDADRDGTMSMAELEDSIIALLVVGDIQLFDDDRYAPHPASTAPDSVSLAFTAHAIPCDDSCAPPPPTNTCRDRIRDGDETDVDCGGSCQPCADGLACTAPADCYSQGCTGGTCRAATCSDGVRDGVESDIDCGGPCSPCNAGRVCAADSDCASNACDNGMTALGRCQP